MRVYMTDMVGMADDRVIAVSGKVDNFEGEHCKDIRES
jgi:hypothetical protein